MVLNQTFEVKGKSMYAYDERDVLDIIERQFGADFVKACCHVFGEETIDLRYQVEDLESAVRVAEYDKEQLENQLEDTRDFINKAADELGHISEVIDFSGVLDERELLRDIRDCEEYLRRI